MLKWFMRKWKLFRIISRYKQNGKKHKEVVVFCPYCEKDIALMCSCGVITYIDLHKDDCPYVK